MERPAGREPDWLSLPPAAGRWSELGVDGARVWTPAQATDRVLVAHDGPDYDKHAGLGRYVAASITAGRIPPYRLVLLPAVDRLETYAASPAYARHLSQEILPRVAGGLVVGMGASLGALAMLHCQRRHPASFAALFLQSGSFFQPRFDKQESGFARWLRIVRFTGRVLRASGGPPVPVPVTMTCGRHEENLANNRSMADALRSQDYPVVFAENEGGHDWPAWRDALDPHLTSLLNGLERSRSG
ncbi:alpha/beta hydrolase-fold protein [Actinoplanes sp. NPDC049596]|uniref:alpha/beta hydrolase n=1 Tax=unclassified Actinoplanes TaxID=2626549 RepID=UPI0034424AB6